MNLSSDSGGWPTPVPGAFAVSPRLLLISTIVGRSISGTGYACWLYLL